MNNFERDIDYIRVRVEEAGSIIPFLNVGHTKPKGYSSCWPEVVYSWIEAYGWNESKIPRYTPTKKEIDETEEVLDWITDMAKYCQVKNMPYVARTVCYGMIHYRDTGRRKNSWRKLGRMFHCSHNTAKKWYEDGLEIIARQQNSSLCSKFGCGRM